MSQSTIRNTETQAATVDTSQAPRARDTYQRLSDEIRAVPDSALVGINIAVPPAVATVLGAVPRIRELRPSMASLPAVDIAEIDKLEDYALALAHAHTLYLAASEPPQPIEQLVTDGTSLRHLLLADATALAARGHVNEQRLKEVRGSTGYLDLAFDLTTLAALMREALSAGANRPVVYPAELDRAETIAEQLMAAVGSRTQVPAVVAAAGDVRQRAFTLMVHAYDEARRAVSFLRWRQGDADAVAPSLYAGRTGKRRTGAAAQDHAATPAAGAVQAGASTSETDAAEE
jgi:hypothetical protein